MAKLRTDQSTAQPTLQPWPPSGGWVNPYNVANSAASAPTSGAVDFQPFLVGPGISQAIQAIGVSVTTALVAGSATVVCKVGLYADDGVGSPLLTSLLEQGDVTLTAINGRASVLVTRTLPPGRYWGAVLYAVTSGTPTTAPAFTAINSAIGLWYPNSITIGTSVRSLRLTGQTALPTTAQTLTVNGGNTAPVVGIRAA